VISDEVRQSKSLTKYERLQILKATKYNVGHKIVEEEDDDSENEGPLKQEKLF
jgi:hypothetical protein